MDAHTVAGLLSAAARLLAGEEARADAELLLAGALGRNRAWLYAHGDATPDATQRARFEAWVARRCRGEPVAHLLGQREFWSLSLQVTADTLVPRADTERLVELALERLATDAPSEILDLGTGSGAVALAVASERPQARVVAVDRDARALEVARRNAARLGLDRVSFLQGDWFSPVRGRRFGLVVGNPPYLAADDPHLAEGDLRFEPRDALVSGHDGLDAIRRIVADAPVHLLADGWLLLEHGWSQAPAVRALLERRGFVDVASWTDLEGRDRVSGGRAAS
jgi:release factor glutamine methyltransferase